MSVDLPHQARRIDPFEARDAEATSWERAKEADTEHVSKTNKKGRFSVQFSDGEQHDVVLVEDDHGFAGCCDCNGFAFHEKDVPGAGCAHLYLLCQMGALNDHLIPKVDDVDVVEPEDMDVEVIEHGGDAGDVQEASADLPDRDDHAGNATPAKIDNPFAGEIEDVDDRFMMTLGGDPYIRREGFQRLARSEGYRVETEMRTWASDTDCELAEASARVLDEDGTVVATGSGTAYLPEEDLSGAKGNLNELAETRALSRAMGWATGAGLSAVEVDASEEFDEPDPEVATDGGR